MNLYTAEQMQAIDRYAIETLGIPGEALMETAGRGAAARAIRMLEDPAGAAVIVLVGKGNNGGDGLVVARVLHDVGARVRVVFASEISEGTGPAAANLAIARKLNIPMEVYNGDAGSLSPDGWGPPRLIVDALLGVGSRGAPRTPLDGLIEAGNSLGVPVLAVDIPSGLDSSTGQVPGACIRAAVTVTFGCGKVGLYSDPGVRYAGRVEVIDIGFTRASLGAVRTKVRLIEPGLVAEWLPERPPWANKGTFGTVLLVAGSEGMMGAAALCSRAAIRAGAGLAYLIVPQSLVSLANLLTVEVVCKSVPDAGGRLGAASVEAILEQKAKAVAIGPGLSTHPDVAAMLEALLPLLETPMVIDADALNLLARNREVLRRRKAPAILTPHPGEMGRLLGIPTEAVQADRIGSARRLASECDVFVVLKGQSTVIASPDGEILLNPSGNAAMATGGTGDVLTGAIASLLAQGLEPMRAAGAGVFLHATAGDLWRRERGDSGLLASELADLLPRAREAVRAANGPNRPSRAGPG